MLYPEQESSTLEFKESLPKNNQIIKTVVGFCNQNGGRIIIGVDDKGMIKGIPGAEAQSALEYLYKSIFESTSPPIIPRIYAQSFGDRTIVIIEVSSGMNKPYYVKSLGLDKGVYVRLGRSTVLATTQMIEELKWQARGFSFDSLPLYHATEKDLDEKAIRHFLVNRKQVKEAPFDLHESLVAYHILIQEHGHYYPTVGGMLTFGKDPNYFLSEAMIICTRFAGNAGREVIATRDCVGRLNQQFSEAFHFIVSQLNRSFTIAGPQRTELLEIPQEAIREALLNAIVHRNYHIQSPTKIAIFDNRVEIFSPGNFPGPLTSRTLKMGFTYIRNPMIARAFREMGYIEKLGSGIITIFESYEKRRLKEPEIFESDTFVKYILPRPSAGHIPLKQELEDEMKSILSLFDKAADLSVGDIIKLTNISRATIGRKLALLVKDGVLRKIGAGRNTRYSLILKT